MYNNLKTIIRVSIGLLILMIGIIGLLLPILPGWILIFVAIPIIHPEYGKLMIDKLKKRFFSRRDHSTPTR